MALQLDIRLTAAVASGSVLNIPYPSGESSSTLETTGAYVEYDAGGKLSSGFSVSLAADYIKVTNSTGATWGLSKIVRVVLKETDDPSPSFGPYQWDTRLQSNVVNGGTYKETLPGDRTLIATGPYLQYSGGSQIASSAYSVSIGATQVTVTNSTGSTWEAGKIIRLVLQSSDGFDIETPSVASMVSADDSGSSNSDGITSDTTPGFVFNLPLGYGDERDVTAGDTLRVQSNGSDIATVTLTQNQIDGIDTINLGAAAFSDGAKAIRCRLERAGGLLSNWSSALDIIIDSTAATLSSPTGTKTGETTATISVAHNETNGGTLYWVVDTGSTPSAAQVKAGQDSGGASADRSGSVLDYVSGASISVTSLSSGTTFKGYFAYEDAAGNLSSVAASSDFTTDNPPFSITYTDYKLATGSGLTRTASAAAIGSADADRVVVVGIYQYNGDNGAGVTAPNGVTIGGVSATKINGDGNSLIHSSLWYAEVPTGTTADVVATWTGAGSSVCGVAVWRVKTTTAAPSSSVTQSGASNTTTTSPSITVPSGGGMIAFIGSGFDARTVSGWTNATQDFAQSPLDGTYHWMSGATRTTAGATTVTCTTTTNSQFTYMVCAAWNA